MWFLSFPYASVGQVIARRAAFIGGIEAKYPPYMSTCQPDKRCAELRRRLIHPGCKCHRMWLGAVGGGGGWGGLLISAWWSHFNKSSGKDTHFPPRSWPSRGKHTQHDIPKSASDAVRIVVGMRAFALGAIGRGDGRVEGGERLSA